MNPKVLILMTDFNQNHVDFSYLSKIRPLQNLIKIRSAVLQLLYEDRQTDRRDKGNRRKFGHFSCKYIYKIFSVAE